MKRYWISSGRNSKSITAVQSAYRTRVIAIVSPESAPIKRIIQEAKDKGTLIDATYGRRTRAVLIMDSDHVVLSAVAPETVGGRAAVDEEDDDNDNV